MASSSLHCHSTTILSVLIFLASSSSLQARMLPSDVHDDDNNVHVKELSAVSSNPTASTTVDSLALMAPPPPPPAAGKPEMMPAVDGKRWGTAQLQGSVPSPGIGN
ncbi:hypothetical protein EE612_027769 [Oryza sativa]|nr:hypothetical protein EE612_027769 [Oryza sativa]